MSVARAVSSAGRASRLHRGGRGFESLIAHHFHVKPKLWRAGLLAGLISLAPAAVGTAERIGVAQTIFKWAEGFPVDGEKRVL